MSDIVTYQKHLLEELEWIKEWSLNTKSIGMYSDRFISTIDWIANYIHSYNIKNDSIFQPTEYFHKALIDCLRSIPKMDSIEDRKKNYINDDYLAKYKIYTTWALPEEGVHHGFLLKDMSYENDTFINHLARMLNLNELYWEGYLDNKDNLSWVNPVSGEHSGYAIVTKNGKDYDFCSFLKLDQTRSDLIEAYPKYLKGIQNQIDVVYRIFNININTKEVLETGYASIYKEKKLHIVYDHFSTKIKSDITTFVNLLSGKRSEEKIIVSMRGTELYSLIKLLYPPGEVDSSSTLANVLKLFTDTNGMLIEANNESKNAGFKSRLKELRTKLSAN